MSSRNIFTVFGLQRSGTNFTEQLIRLNLYNVQISNAWRVTNGIWKHIYDIENKHQDQAAFGLKGDPNKEKLIGSTVNSVYIHKHPYSWIQSITRKNVDIAKTYPFVTNLSNQSRYNMGKLNLLELVRLYNEHTNYWLNKMKTRKIFHVKYEDLIASEDATREYVRDISKFTNIHIVNNEIKIPKRVSQSANFNEQSRKMYLEVDTSSLTQDQINIINEHIDKDMVKLQGYSLV